MEEMEEEFRAACEAGHIPGVILLAKNKSGNLSYAQAFGLRSLKDDTARPPMALDTIIRISSCTALVTSVAAMQCVEQGLLDLDADVLGVLPELADLKILDEFDTEGKPVMKEVVEPITLRRLLSHTSGFCYESTSPLLMNWRAYHGEEGHPRGTKIEDRYACPLVFEPGTSWTYGPSIDWAGRMVERVNGDTPLEEYMQEHIWQPLGIKDMTFFLRNRFDMLLRCADTSTRNTSENGKTVHTNDHSWHEDNDDCFGGTGLFAAAPGFMKILHSLLADDGKLLKPETVDLLFQPQLNDNNTQEAFTAFFRKPSVNEKLGALMPLGLQKSHALGGMLLMEDIPNDAKWRRKGTMTWSGLPNVFWFIDRKAGLCAMYASQLQGAGDRRSIELARLFERTMYAELERRI